MNSSTPLLLYSFIALRRSVLVFRRRHPFGAWEFPHEHLRIVDQHRQMLRANVERTVLVRQRDERDLSLRATAGEAG